MKRFQVMKKALVCRFCIIVANIVVCGLLFKAVGCNYKSTSPELPASEIIVDFNLARCVVDLSRFNLTNEKLLHLQNKIKNGKDLESDVINSWYTYYGKSVAIESINRLLKATHTSNG